MEKFFAEAFDSLHALFTSYRNTQRCLAAFNVNDCYDLQAVVNAANTLGSHVMVMTYPPVAELLSPEMFYGLVTGARHHARHNVYLHLDHSSSVDLCKQAIDAGYDSVMFDGSQLSLEKNIAGIKEVVKYAESANVLVEAEIGKILGRGVEIESDDDYLASVEDVRCVHDDAGPDLIAVGIGTAHGFTPQEPKVHFDRLNEIAEAVPAPLVLHGGTGIPDADIQKAIGMGISKINIGTIVHTTYMKYVGDALNAAGDSAYPPFIMKSVIPEIEKVVADRLSAVNEQ